MFWGLALLVLGAAAAISVPQRAVAQQVWQSGYSGRIELAPGLPCTTCLVQSTYFGRGTKTDQDGAFVIKLGPGDWELIVSAPDLPKVKFDISLAVVRFDATTTKVESAVGGTLPVWRPWATGSVSGRIVATSPQTIASAVVYAEGQGMIVKPNADGYFALADVAPGPRKLVVTAAGHTPHSFSIQMPAGGHVGDVVVELDRGAARAPDVNPPKLTDTAPDQPSAADRQKTKAAPKPPLR
jgi:hypothetical protein